MGVIFKQNKLSLAGSTNSQKKNSVELLCAYSLDTFMLQEALEFFTENGGSNQELGDVTMEDDAIKQNLNDPKSVYVY